MDSTPDAKWIRGINSLLDPALLQPGEYPWSINTDNTGGIIQTRQGFNAVGVKNGPLPSLEPKGCAFFKDGKGNTSLVIAIGEELWSLSFPIVGDFKKLGTGFLSKTDPVIFCRVLQSTTLADDGTIQVLPVPIPYLIMQNGVERPKYWDGKNLLTSDLLGPIANGHFHIPIGKWMAWSGSRLWISIGRALVASDLGNPLSFFEITYVAGGGPLYFDDEVTGLTQTADFQNLIVCTDFDTSAVQSNVYDRTIWGSTPGFQRVIFPGVGCAAGKSFVRQWGITWWMSHGGWVGMDQALMTYQRSRIQYRDQQMMRAKEKLNGDISGICANKFGNIILVSVPYGSRYNAGTWVLNQRVIDISAPSPAADYQDPAAWSSQWTGILPVEYALTVINGQERLFCLSRHQNIDGSAQPVVWEMFTGERQDRYNDSVFQIPCMMETRLLGFSEDLKTFHYGEMDVSELLGLINAQAWVAGRQGNYHQIMDKDIVASQGSVNSAITSSFVTEVTEDTPGDAQFIPTKSVEGALEPPALIFINGVSYKYIEVRVGQGHQGGGNPPQDDAETGQTGFVIEPPGTPGTEQLNPPVSDPPGGTYDTANLFVRVSEVARGAKIAWTLDNTDPSRTNGNQSIQNNVTIRIGPGNGTYTLKSMAYIPDDPNSDSEVREDIYILQTIETPDDDSPLGPNTDIPDFMDQPEIEVPAPPIILTGSQVIQPQFEYPYPSTILTSYVPQRRMLRTEEWDIRNDECSACGVESRFTDNIDRGFSLLIKWKGRMAINAIRIMTEKYTLQAKRGQCEEDEATSRAIDQAGCGDKSSTIIEPPIVDVAPLKSQYLRSVSHRAYDEEPYSPIPVQVVVPVEPPPNSPLILSHD